MEDSGQNQSRNTKKKTNLVFNGVDLNAVKKFSDNMPSQVTRTPQQMLVPT